MLMKLTKLKLDICSDQKTKKDKKLEKLFIKVKKNLFGFSKKNVSIKNFFLGMLKSNSDFFFPLFVTKFSYLILEFMNDVAIVVLFVMHNCGRKYWGTQNPEAIREPEMQTFCRHLLWNFTTLFRSKKCTFTTCQKKLYRVKISNKMLIGQMNSKLSSR